MTLAERLAAALVSGETTAHLSSGFMTSPTVSSKLRPSWPAGWNLAKSSFLKPRFTMRAAARASPIARVTMALVVGTRARGSASG